MSTSTWTGDVSSDWADADNWSPAGVPDASSDVVISVGDRGRFGIDRDGQFDHRYVRPLLRVGGNEYGHHLPGQHRFPER